MTLPSIAPSVPNQLNSPKNLGGSKNAGSAGQLNTAGQLSTADRVPPQNLEAEASVLGALLLDKDAIVKVADFLVSSSFYKEAYRVIYEAMLALFEAREPIDVLSLSDKLKSKGELERLGGTETLTSLVNGVASAAHVTHYARIVQRKATLRRLITASNEITHMSYQASEDVESILDQAEQKLFQVSQAQLKQNFIPLKSVLADTFERIDELHRNRGQLRGIATGFTDLDELLAGLQRSNLVVLAARPSMGKTTFALDIVRNIVVNLKMPVGFFSLEMSRDELVDRLLASQAQIDLWKLRTGRLAEREGDNDFERLNDAMGILSEAPLFIDDSAGTNVMELRTKARRLHAEHKLGLIVVDYLQLMEGRQTENRVQEVSEISRALKSIARELNVPVLALSQLSRAVEQRDSKIPQLSDLRESGCLAGDTLITMADTGARVSIRTLAGKSGFKILSLNEQTLKIEPAVVSNAFSTGAKKVFSLRTRLGRTIRATGNHKFRLLNTWQRLDKLNVGDRIALPRKLLSGSGSSVSEAEASLLGLLIGDGCTLPRHAIQYTTQEVDLAEIAAGLATSIFGERIRPRINRERTWYQVYLAAAQHLTHGKSNPIAQWLRTLSAFGLRSYEKFIPAEMFEQPINITSAFLRHLWATDGCIRPGTAASRYPAIYYASSSETLAQDVQSLLVRHGINAVVRSVDQGKKGRTQFHVAITGHEEVMSFARSIGAVGAYKTLALAECVQQIQTQQANTNRDVIPSNIWRSNVVPAMQQHGITSRQLQNLLGHEYCGTSLYKQNVSRERLGRVALAVQNDEYLMDLANSDVYWDEIVSIEPAGTEDVYDLTVPGFSNFVANDIISHNSIEQDADVVMFIYREAMYKKDAPNKNLAEIHVRKHRNGPTGQIELFFNSQQVRFQNLSRAQTPNPASLPPSPLTPPPPPASISSTT